MALHRSRFGRDGHESGPSSTRRLRDTRCLSEKEEPFEFDGRPRRLKSHITRLDTTGYDRTVRHRLEAEPLQRPSWNRADFGGFEGTRMTGPVSRPDR